MSVDAAVSLERCSNEKYRATITVIGDIMTEIIYYVAMSLDAYIATADGGIEWLFPFETADEDYGYAEFYGSVDAVLLGRRTFEQSLTFSTWPYPGKPCWVFSRQRHESAQPQVTFTSQSPVQVVSDLRTRGFRRAWLVGGGELAGSFRAHRLITEYIVSIIPVILGAGIPLFTSSGPEENLQHVAAKSYANGVIQLRYTHRGAA